MRTIISQKVKEALGDIDNVKTYIDEINAGSVLNNNIETKKSEIKEKADVVKNAEAEMKGEKSSDITPKIGDKFTYTDSKGTYNLEITVDNGDGTFKAKTPDNKVTTLDSEKIKKLVPEKQGTNTELTPQTGAPKADLSKKL